MLAVSSRMLLENRELRSAEVPCSTIVRQCSTASRQPSASASGVTSAITCSSISATVIAPSPLDAVRRCRARHSAARAICSRPRSRAMIAFMSQFCDGLRDEPARQRAIERGNRDRVVDAGADSPARAIPVSDASATAGSSTRYSLNPASRRPAPAHRYRRRIPRLVRNSSGRPVRGNSS